MSKFCPHCGNEIPKPARIHGSNYHAAKYCSRRCSGLARRNAAEKLLAKTMRDEASGCLLWQGKTNAYGYPAVSVGCKMKLASRVVLEHKLGRKLAHRECACHTCDTPRCINPDHLWAGTHQENMQDSARKGRNSHGVTRGTDHPFAKIDAEIARSIVRNEDGLIARQLADRFGISTGTVYDILHGRKWAWATGLERLKQAPTQRGAAR